MVDTVACVKFRCIRFAISDKNSFYSDTFILKAYIKLGYKRFNFTIQVSKIVLDFAIGVVYATCYSNLRLGRFSGFL